MLYFFNRFFCHLNCHWYCVNIFNVIFFCISFSLFKLLFFVLHIFNVIFFQSFFRHLNCIHIFHCDFLCVFRFRYLNCPFTCVSHFQCYILVSFFHHLKMLIWIHINEFSFITSFYLLYFMYNLILRFSKVFYYLLQSNSIWYPVINFMGFMI